MSQEGAFDEGADGVAFVGVELVDGFDVVAEVVGDGAFFWVEEEHICADGEFGGKVSEDVEGGLAGAGFIAADVGDVEAGELGEGVLGEAGVFAGGDATMGRSSRVRRRPANRPRLSWPRFPSGPQTIL